MNATLFFAGMCAAILLLPGCGGGEDPVITSYDPYQGSEGVRMDILDNAPPTEVFENDAFNIVVKLHNKGAYDLIPTVERPEELAYFQLAYDSFYFLPLDATVAVPLEAKKYENQDGGFELVEFIMTAKAIEGQREAPTTQLLFTLCYPYHTTFRSDVCIDGDPFGMDVRHKTCDSQTQTFSNQGAPIAVTKVEPRMPTRRNNNRREVAPSFIITLKNLGNGNVLQRSSSPQQDCVGMSGAGHGTWGTATVTARLSDEPLSCIPQKISFMDRNQATTTCKLASQDGFIPLEVLSRPDVLFVDVDYLYVTSETKEIRIRR